MVTKRDLEVAIAAYGLGRILPAGSTRAAARRAVSTVVKAGRVVGPPAARTAGRFAAANPLVTAGLLGAGAYQAGLFDPAIEEARMQSAMIQEDLRRRALESDIQRGFEMAGRPDLRQEVPKRARKRVNKFSKAVGAGVKAVKASKFDGAKGKLKDAKKTFSKVTKVASRLKAGKKVSTKGVTGTIRRAIRRFY